MGNIEKGYLGSLIVEKKFVMNGFNVFKPVMENGKVDMIVEKNNIYLKIQIKTIQESKGNKNVPVRKISHNMGNYKISTYSNNEIDYFIGVDVDTEDVYLIPIVFSEQYKSAISISKISIYKNNFDLKELHFGNIVNVEDNIGEYLTDNADVNTEGMK
jgi:hypothetical protein